MKSKKQNGITLIALIITIIVMLILAAVVLNLTIGENGIFKTAKYAANETKKTQVQEEIQLAVTDIVTRHLSQGKDITNLLLKEEVEKYNSLKGITIDEDLKGTYKGYNYYIDETYTVYIGDKTSESIIAKILVNEINRKITVTITDLKEGIDKIEIVDPKEKIIATKQINEQVTSEKLEATANLSGVYKVKVTNKNNKTQEKIINVKKIEITNKEELLQFGKMVNDGVTFEGDTVTLLSDIDLVGSASNKNWESIGGSQEDKYFAGTFEGKEHKISGIYNKDTTKGVQGFFGYVNGGTVQNLGIESGNIIGKYSVGGIVGKINNGTIMNCYNKAKIECLDSEADYGGMRIGGITGYAINTTITQCYNDGEINGNLDTAGGIVGRINNKTKVENCYNTGNIMAKQYVGGIVGFANENEDNSMNNCYNTGSVTAKSFIGGLIGSLYKGNRISNSYNVGSVSGSDSCIGGVIGENCGILSNLFFINTAGPEWGCGTNITEYGLEEANGSSEETLKGLTYKLNGEQNPKPWKEDEKNINDGYPILSWQNSGDTNET